MFKYLLMTAILVPVSGQAADLIESGEYVRMEQSYRICPREQNGNQYCTETPVEKRIADCTPGFNCTHMQSGQHYSVQRPVILN